MLESVRRELEAPGAVLGVLRGDGTPVVVATGLADRQTGRPMDASAPYFLGSVTKVYTAAVVLRLAEDGVLTLDDPLARWLPDFPRAEEITLRHLLAHTSGLKDFYLYLYYRPDRDEMIELVTRDWTEDELLELAGRFGHRFDPGTDWAYSNANYYLLGVVVERATGDSLPEAYEHFLFEPLGLRRTWLTLHEERPGSVAGALPTGYLGPVEGWPHAEMFGALGPTTVLDHSPVEWGAGGLAAPAGDALGFLHGLLRGELLEPASLEAMIRFRPTPALGVAAAEGEPENGYGLGLVRMERAGLELVGHGGLFTGHTAGLWHVPERDLTIALCFNRGFVGQRTALDRVLPVVAGEDAL